MIVAMGSSCVRAAIWRSGADFAGGIRLGSPGAVQVSALRITVTIATSTKRERKKSMEASVAAGFEHG
jgi:hypothetical protein